MYENVMCCVCGENPAEKTWMCRKCYDKLSYKLRVKPKKGYKSAKESHPQGDRTIKIISEYLKGEKNQTQIAKECGVSRQWVSYIIKRYKDELSKIP